MVGDEKQGGSSPNLPSVHGSSGLAGRFADKADLTNLLVSEMRLESVSAQQAFFSGTIFRNCTFMTCNFRRSEFEATTFEDCRFENCDFSIADFRSAQIARSTFSHCNFEEGSIKESAFFECAIENCKFFQQSFQESQLERCQLTNCDFHRSTSLHNEFVATRFANTDLADCTALYHIFSGCDFANCRINAESVGMSFGLTRDNLSCLGLTWLGEQLPPPNVTSDTLIADLITTYRHRGWPLPAAMMELNFGLLSRLAALAVVIRSIEAGTRPLVVDEVRFVAHVIEWLSRTHRVPFLAIIDGLEAVSAIAERRDARAQAALKPLHYALKDAEYAEVAALNDIQRSIANAPVQQEIEVELVFSSQPDEPVEPWLAAVHSAYGLAGPPPRLAEIRRGSYIEIFWMLPAALACVVVALSMVARGIDQLIDIRARAGILLSPSLPVSVRRRALQPLPAAAPELLDQIKVAMAIMAQPGGAQFIRHGQTLADKLEKIRTEI